MRKVLLGLSVLMTCVLLLGGTANAATTLLSDDFEGTVKWNPNSSGWNISTSRAYSPTHSAHAPSQTGTSPMMIYGPFDLSEATTAALDFRLWYYAPTSGGSATKYGSFCVGYSIDGSDFTFPYQWSGSTSGEWWATSFDLGAWSIVGQPQVWIACKTTQWNASAYSEGAYVDDLVLTATVADTKPPRTKATGQDGKWHKAAVTVTFTATDGTGGSGVDYTQYSTDGGASWSAGTSVAIPAPADHSNDGTHSILYQSVDNAGNWETARSAAVKIDTCKPKPAAPFAANAVHGRIATLAYSVADPRPGGPTATVTIRIKDPAGLLVKTLKLGAKSVNKPLTASFTVPRTWRGAYRFFVYATDQAGNTQTKAASNALIVK